MKIIFDVGSYDGKDYLEQCKSDPDLHIYAFEPQPIMVKRIKESTKGLDNFHLYNCALADYDGEAKFYLSGGGAGGFSSLFYYFPGTEWGKKKFDTWINVSVMRLETFINKHKIPHIDYLHIDAQGADLKVLQGLGPYYKIVKAGELEVHTKQLYAGEHSVNDTDQWLKEHNFSYRRNDTNGAGREENWYFTSNDQ